MNYKIDFYLKYILWYSDRQAVSSYDHRCSLDNGIGYDDFGMSNTRLGILLCKESKEKLINRMKREIGRLNDKTN